MNHFFSFNGSTVGEPWLGRPSSYYAEQATAGFNGSTVGEPWLGPSEPTTLRAGESRFNGSTVGEPWLGRNRRPIPHALARLQWVHGRRTVVRASSPVAPFIPTELQWVHGRRTVVRSAAASISATVSSFNGSTVGEPWLGRQDKYKNRIHRVSASMGPRSENRG